MKKLILGFLIICQTTYAFADVWSQMDFLAPIEQYTTQAREEVLGPIQSKKNFSGLTLVPQTRSYYAIVNKGDTIFEFDENFNLKRSIALQGFDDPEDLTFVKMTPQGPLFAISEEPGRILIGVITSENSLKSSKMIQIKLIDESGRELSFYDNKGLEGITFIPQEEKFVVLKEKNPIKVWSFNLSEAQVSGFVRVKNFLNSATESKLTSFVTDLSAVSYHAKEQSIVLLSDESSKLIYVPLATKEITKVVNIKTKLQHEALAFSPDFMNTYVGAEPYYLLRINQTNTIQAPSL